MKKIAPKITCIRISLCFSLIQVTLITTNLNAQEKKLNPALFRNYVQPGSNVRVKTVAAERINDSATTTLNNITLPDTGKRVVMYKGEISKLDLASLKLYNAATNGNTSAEDVKVIPEIHIETRNNDNNPLTYRVLFSMKQPLQYNTASNKFSGKLGFMLMSDSDNTAPVKEPVKIEVRSDKIKSIAPDKLTIDHLSIPSTDINLETDRVSDSVDIRVSTVSNPLGYLTYLKVNPVLEISSNRKSLQGLGIQEIPINVRLIGSNSADSVKVVFSTEKGSLTPASLFITYNNPTTILLRSEGLGECKISAASSSVKSNELVFTFNFPWAFLLAALIGGLVGGAAKYFTSGDKNRSVQKFIIGGLLIGIIAAIAYGVGINLVGVTAGSGMNEVLVFTISAIGAYFGIRFPNS